MRSATQSPAVRSWRDIPQHITPRAMSREGRRRLVMSMVKMATLVAGAAMAAWGGYYVFQLWEEDPARLMGAVKAEPVREIAVRTDGVLDHGWVQQTLAIPPSAGLMELDLPGLQNRLLAHGQIRSVVLTRRFPDTLIVTLQERTPVVRVLAQRENEPAQTWLVARDGVVFAGAGFSRDLLGRLPWLAVEALRREGESFAPVAGMETVADLLTAAQANVPDLYRRWLVVSLERLQSDGEIIVRGEDVAEITFGATMDFYSQLARLDLLLGEAVPPTAPPIRSINLAIGGAQVPVAFERTVAPPPPARGSSPWRSSIFPNAQRNVPRDF